jgi:hypothetical protein
METILSAKLPDVSHPQFHLPPLGTLAYRRLVAKFAASNQERTISLKAEVWSCINKQTNNKKGKYKINGIEIIQDSGSLSIVMRGVKHE